MWKMHIVIHNSTDYTTYNFVGWVGATQGGFAPLDRKKFRKNSRNKRKKTKMALNYSNKPASQKATRG